MEYRCKEASMRNLPWPARPKEGVIHLLLADDEGYQDTQMSQDSLLLKRSECGKKTQVILRPFSNPEAISSQNTQDEESELTDSQLADTASESNIEITQGMSKYTL